MICEYILQHMLYNTITTHPPSVHWAPQNSLKVTKIVGKGTSWDEYPTSDVLLCGNVVEKKNAGNNVK